MLGNKLVLQESGTGGIEGPRMPFTENDDAMPTSYRTLVHSVKTRNSHDYINTLQTMRILPGFSTNVLSLFQDPIQDTTFSLEEWVLQKNSLLQKAASPTAAEHSLTERPGVPGARWGAVRWGGPDVRARSVGGAEPVAGCRAPRGGGFL